MREAADFHIPWNYVGILTFFVCNTKFSADLYALLLL